MQNKRLLQTYFVWTIGCQMNQADSRRLTDELETRGLRAVKTADEADVIALNTCVVRQQAEDRARGRLNSLKNHKKRRPGSVVCVMGCLVGVKSSERAALQKIFPFVDVWMSPSDIQPLLAYIDHRQEPFPRPAAESETEGCSDSKEAFSPYTAFVSVVFGCSHACSFCIIPFQRGPERSRPMNEILDDMRRFADRGVREIMLLGQIVDRYGLDLDDGVDLAGLLRAADQVPGIQRIRFLTSHPCWMTDAVIEAVAELESVCPHFEIPVQAGNDEVLQRMRRGYTVDEYRRLVDRVRRRIPDATINTDLILGFPGETHEQFLDTLKVVKEMRFDKVHTAKYSPRRKTLAARRFEDDVPEAEKSARLHQVDALQEQILREKNAVWLGQQVEVLVEARKNERWFGRTPHNRLVFFDDARDLAGKVVQVEIAHAGPFSLTGQVVDRLS